MIIEKKIRLKNNYYFVGFKFKYNKDGFLIKENGNIIDLGDINIAIEYFEKEYNNHQKYTKLNGFLEDIIYLYDRLPIIYIKDIYYDKDNNINTIGCISSDEILEYIKENNIEINKFDRKLLQDIGAYNIYN